jgi:hypothetical protein
VITDQAAEAARGNRGNAVELKLRDQGCGCRGFHLNFSVTPAGKIMMMFSVWNEPATG